MLAAIVIVVFIGSLESGLHLPNTSLWVLSWVQHLAMMGPQEMFSDSFAALVNAVWGSGTWGWWVGAHSKGWRHPLYFSGRGWKEWKQNSEAGNFVNDSAPAKIGDSLVDQIKGYYSRNSPLSLFICTSSWMFGLCVLSAVQYSGTTAASAGETEKRSNFFHAYSSAFLKRSICI